MCLRRDSDFRSRGSRVEALIDDTKSLSVSTASTNHKPFISFTLVDLSWQMDSQP